MNKEQFLSLCREFKLDPDHYKTKDVLIAKLCQEGRAKPTGRYFIKTSWKIGENKLRSELGKLGISIEKEYDIDFKKEKSVFRTDFKTRIKDIVTKSGGKFEEERFNKVKSKDLETALGEYFS